jgi:hypothetical protein
MIPALDFSSLKDARWSQFVLRFALGGAVTACTGLVAQHWGPIVGGLFLAFPAIFPASATLIEKHQAEQKRKAGLEGGVRGRKAAALDAAGAVFGGCGLACFGRVAATASARGCVGSGICGPRLVVRCGLTVVDPSTPVTTPCPPRALPPADHACVRARAEIGSARGLSCQRSRFRRLPGCLASPGVTTAGSTAM